MVSPRRRGRLWEAITVAALLHAGVVVVVDGLWEDTAFLFAPAPPAPAPPVPPIPVSTPVTSAGFAGLTFLTAPPPAIPLEAILGTGDRVTGDGQARLPDAADLPGTRAADRGGGAVAGADTWADRRDRVDDAALRSRVWTSPDAYLAPRTPGQRRAASPEAVTRSPQTQYGERAVRRPAAAGAAQASIGADVGTGAPGTPLVVGPGQDRAGAAGATTPARRDGAVVAVTEAAYVDRGDQAVDVARRGATADDRSVAAASDQPAPDPFDLTPPRSGGGPGAGVAGVPGPGAVTDGWGRGTAASRAQAPAGDDGAPTYASRRDPYFLELFRRLDERVVYPRELAVSLTSGRVVAQLTLNADGTFVDVGLHASSGYPAFDQQITGALRTVGKLGPVPAGLLRGRASLRVRVPYTFRNPMIQ
ncbi:MAG: energy transducer TonB [Kofleriaceae bacterium]